MAVAGGPSSSPRGPFRGLFTTRQLASPRAREGDRGRSHPACHVLSLGVTFRHFCIPLVTQGSPDTMRKGLYRGPNFRKLAPPPPPYFCVCFGVTCIEHKAMNRSYIFFWPLGFSPSLPLALLFQRMIWSSFIALLSIKTVHALSNLQALTSEFNRTGVINLLYYLQF